MTPSTYRMAVAPSYVPVARCQPEATAPPSAHPYCDPQEPVLPVPLFTMNWYIVPVASTPKYSPASRFVSAIPAKEACVVTTGFTHADTESVVLKGIAGVTPELLVPLKLKAELNFPVVHAVLDSVTLYPCPD
jgi:hypothetical protein